MNWYLGCWKKYVEFSGRARRQEYWMFFLFNFLAGFACAFVDGLLGTGCALNGLYTLAVLLPVWAVTCRRLHDIGHSGWWWLIVLIPLVGPLILLVFLCRDSQPGENRFGANPKGR